MLFSVYKDLGNAFELFKALFKTSFKILSLIILLIGFFLVFCLATSLPSNSSNKLEWILKAPFLAVQFFKKGFDLASMLNISNDISKILCFESSLFSMMISIPINCLCIALMLKIFLEKLIGTR